MRDAQKGRKSWLERLTSPPESDDEQPSAGERSPFDQPGPFDQGPFDHSSPFDQPGPFDAPGEQSHGGVGDGFDAFAPPALRKPGGDDAKADGADRSKDLPPAKSQERSGGKPGGSGKGFESKGFESKGFDSKGFDRSEEHPSGPQKQASAPGQAREPWEIPVPGLGVPRSSQAPSVSSPGPASGPTATAGLSPALSSTPSPGPASGPSASVPSPASNSGPVGSVSSASPTPVSSKDSGPIPLVKPGSASATTSKTSDPSGPSLGAGIRDRSDDESSFGPSSWQSDAHDTDDVPGIGGGRRPSRDGAADMKLPEEVVPMPSGPSEDEQREAARRRHIEELQHRWLVTQAQLLDDPRDAVREAGLLIGDAMQFVTTTFTEHRDRIERDWKRESELSTDELRIVMRRYRNLFQYVLSASQLPDI